MTGRVALAVLLAAGVALLPGHASQAAVESPPTCPEDAVTSGAGSYDGGSWSAWRCVSADDIGPAANVWHVRRAARAGRVLITARSVPGWQAFRWGTVPVACAQPRPTITGWSVGESDHLRFRACGRVYRVVIS